MNATCVEDLQVYQRSLRLTAAVFAITNRFGSDRWLADQLDESVESAMANIADGFRQPTDRAFARYLAIAAASLEEARSHITAAVLRGHLPESQAADLKCEARQLVDMLGGLIGHLRRSDRKDRGRTGPND
jgi:four helix bundle protein